MYIVIIKYNAGNTRSVQLALERLGYQAEVTNDHQAIRAADCVIFPGVGQAYSAMQSLKEKGLDQLIPSLTQPVLGICLGMQLLCSNSEEGDTPCLSIIPEQVRKFQGDLKIPHMGWNTLYDLKGDVFKGIKENSYTYFVHSYFVPVNNFTTAKCEYIQPFSAAIQFKNFHGVQFHPEKSGDAGHQLLKNFLQ